ncbi:MAG: AAA family ATPase [Ferruginibacter sp.]
MIRGTVVVVFGLPGSGKSYFAGRLAKNLDAVYINSDQVRMDLFKKRSYSPEEKDAVYRQMLSKLTEALNQKRNVVLDATFHKADTRELFIKEMEDKGGIQFIEVTAKEDIIRDRLKEERPYSEADFNIYQLISRQFEPFTRPHLLLESTNENIDDMLLQATAYLKNTNDNRTDQ